jgi:hypothetical protein
MTLALVAVPPALMTMFPAMVALPVLTVIWVTAEPAPSVKFKFPPTVNEPAPTLSVLVALLFELTRKTLPETVRLFPAPMFRMVVAALPSARVIELIVVEARSIVTVWPLKIWMSSAAAGTCAQVQVEAELQFPLPVETQAAAWAGRKGIMERIKTVMRTIAKERIVVRLKNLLLIR